MSRPESMMNVRLTLPSAPNERRINESASHIHDLDSVVKQHPASSVSRSRDVRLNAPILSMLPSSGSTAAREPTTTSTTLRRPTHSSAAIFDDSLANYRENQRCQPRPISRSNCTWSPRRGQEAARFRSEKEYPPATHTGASRLLALTCGHGGHTDDLPGTPRF